LGAGAAGSAGGPIGLAALKASCIWLAGVAVCMAGSPDASDWATDAGELDWPIVNGATGAGGEPDRSMANAAGGGAPAYRLVSMTSEVVACASAGQQTAAHSPMDQARADFGFIAVFRRFFIALPPFKSTIVGNIGRVIVTGRSCSGP
jgi:hypothetical protein